MMPNNIDNHMNIPYPEGTDGTITIPHTENQCIVCHLDMDRECEDSSWLSHAFEVTEKNDEGRTEVHLEGESLTDACELEWGAVCSQKCKSQAIYDHATDNEKTALRKLRDACIYLHEYGKVAIDLINKHDENACIHDSTPEEAYTVSLLTEAADVLKALSQDDDPPAWCDCATKESELKDVMQDEQRKAERIAGNLGMEARCLITQLTDKKPDPLQEMCQEFKVKSLCTEAARAANIALNLREAREGR